MERWIYRLALASLTATAVGSAPLAFLAFSSTAVAAVRQDRFELLCLNSYIFSLTGGANFAHSFFFLEEPLLLLNNWDLISGSSP